MINFIDILNTGFGVSIVFSLRDQGKEHIILLDSGDNNPQIYKDARRIKITDYLKYKNIKEIDIAVLSHIHRDHIACFNDILDQGCRINTFLSNIPTNPDFVDPNCLEIISEQYPDIPTQYIIFSLKQYQKLLDRMGDRVYYVQSPMNFLIGDYELQIVPIAIEIIQECLKYLKKSADPLLDLEERYQSLRKFDNQLNQTTLSLLVSTKRSQKYLFYSAGERDLSKKENCLLKEKVEILHCPHHGDSKYLGESLNTLSPKWIVVCSDHQRTYNLPSMDLEKIVQHYCSAHLIYTETTISSHRWITFLLDVEHITPIYRI
ncbi:MAG: hypothetical protein ACRCWI_08645 [Brevinema sp.]